MAPESEQARRNRRRWPILGTTSERLEPLLRSVTFWVVVLLPWLVLVLLFTGFAASEPVLFTAIIAVNLLFTVVGSSYELC